MAVGMIMSNGRFYWNLDANVGVGSPNKTEDVHLVQLAFACRATNTKTPPSAEEKAIFSLVVPGAAYNGGATDPLTVAIQYAQKKRGGVQDGHVSKVLSSGGYYSADKMWMLIGLNNQMSDVLGTNWPFLDRHPRSTTQLKDLITRTFVIV
jgi:hypothetical protein